MRLAFLPSMIPLLLVLAHTVGWGQEASIPVINNTLAPLKGIYRFSSFNEGAIIFRSGIMTAARMNYNISFDEIHFIDQHGDTLALAAPASINFINLNGSRFYYDKGFIQAIDNFNGLVLGFKQVLFAQQQRKGEYGRVSPQEEVSAFHFFRGNGQKYTLAENEEVQVYAREYYFLGNADGSFSKAGRDYFYLQFPQHRSAITRFLKTHHSNFNQLDDLLLLLAFCRQLK